MPLTCTGSRQETRRLCRIGRFGLLYPHGSTAQASDERAYLVEISVHEFAFSGSDKVSFRVFAGPGLPKPPQSAPEIDQASITPDSMAVTWSSWVAPGDEDTTKGKARCGCCRISPQPCRRASASKLTTGLSTVNTKKNVFVVEGGTTFTVVGLATKTRAFLGYCSYGRVSQRISVSLPSPCSVQVASTFSRLSGSGSAPATGRMQQKSL